MKVIYEDSFYCFPEKASINFLVENPHKEALGIYTHIKESEKSDVLEKVFEEE